MVFGVAVRRFERQEILRLQLVAKQSGQPIAPGEALAELLADITEAARTIATILQRAGGGTRPSVPQYLCILTQQRAGLEQVIDIQSHHLLGPRFRVAICSRFATSHS